MGEWLKRLIHFTYLRQREQVTRPSILAVATCVYGEGGWVGGWFDRKVEETRAY